MTTHAGHYSGMRFFISSDWHLDSVTSGVERFEEISRAVREVVDAVIADKTSDKRFVFLGDLTDPHGAFSHRAVAYAMKQAYRVSNVGVASFWMAGNHDVILREGAGTTLEPLKIIQGGESDIIVVDNPTTFEGREKVDEFAPTPHPELGPVLVMLPYVSPDRLYNPAEFIKRLPSFGTRKVLVLGHLTVLSAEIGSESGEFARGRELVFPAEACKEKWGSRVTMVNGHYHKRQTTKDGVIIPGSLARLRHDEEGNTPGYLVIDF
jgi:DNA repair exonuclease SbcCD nuclease subunit